MNPSASEHVCGAMFAFARVEGRTSPHTSAGSKPNDAPISAHSEGDQQTTPTGRPTHSDKIEAVRASNDVTVSGPPCHGSATAGEAKARETKAVAKAAAILRIQAIVCEKRMKRNGLLGAFRASRGTNFATSANFLGHVARS